MSATRNLGLVFIHGGFHGPDCFDLPIRQLEKAGFSPIVGVSLPSIGTDTKVTSDDDGRAVQEAIKPYIDQGKEFLAVAHSYGGTVLTIASIGHSVAERAAQGKKGGIKALVFVTSNMPAKKGGSALSVLPADLDIVDLKDGIATVNSKARESFYMPLMDGALADTFLAACKPQSQEALLGACSVGAEDITTPAYYILCETDQTIPKAYQENIIKSIPTLKRVLVNPGAHCAFITHTDLFVKQILEIADEVEQEK